MRHPPPPPEPEAAVTPAPKRLWAKPTITIMRGGPPTVRSGNTHKAGSTEFSNDHYIDMSS